MVCLVQYAWCSGIPLFWARIIWTSSSGSGQNTTPAQSKSHLYSPESIATLPPFGPIEGQKWFDQISSQWESQKNRFALIYFGKIQFLPPCIWNIPFMSYRLRGLQRDVVYLSWPIATSFTSPFAGGWGCGVSANEYSCAHQVTWSPTKL